MDAFSAYLLVRRFLGKPESRRRARHVGAIMEALAESLGHAVEDWRVLGLLSQLDWESAADNPEVRGKLAREQAELEGLDPALALSLEYCWQTDPPRGELPSHVYGLKIADALADAVDSDRQPLEDDPRLQTPLYKLGLDAAHVQRIIVAAERIEARDR